MHTEAVSQSENVPALSRTDFSSRCPQRLLPIDGANDLFYQPPPSMPTSKLYSIRPYFPKDEVRFSKEMADFSWPVELPGPIPISVCRQLFIKSVKRCTVREWRTYLSSKSPTSLATGKAPGWLWP